MAKTGNGWPGEADSTSEWDEGASEGRVWTKHASLAQAGRSAGKERGIVSAWCEAQDKNKTKKHGDYVDWVMGHRGWVGGWVLLAFSSVGV